MNGSSIAWGLINRYRPISCDHALVNSIRVGRIDEVVGRRRLTTDGSYRVARDVVSSKSPVHDTEFGGNLRVRGGQ